MGMRLGSAHGQGARTGRLLIAASTVALLVTLGATPAAARSATCAVANTDTGRTFPRLQQAVDAAKKGARLVVKGTCHGGTVIDKKLVIEGVRTPMTGKPTLSGAGKVGVLRVTKAVRVRVRGIEILRGHGGGISNRGRLRLVDVVIRDNHARRGGGTSNRGRLTLVDVVIGNNGADRGGGIYNEGLIRMRGSSRVTRNVGGGVHNVGRLVLNDDTRISHSDPSDRPGVYNEGSLVMNDRSVIRDNTGFRVGGGIVNRGTFTMNDSSAISKHYNLGGVRNYGTFTMNDASTIHANSAGGGTAAGIGFGGKGGGVHNFGSLSMHDESRIHGNVAHGWGLDPPRQYPGQGGGVYNEGTLTMTGSASIDGNEAWRDGPGQGGGVYNASGGTLVGVMCGSQTGANVTGNTPDDCYVE